MRRATVRTTHATPEYAALVAGAVEPDNTDSMATHIDGRVVETTIERETTGGLHSSVDDYVVNLTVADRLTGVDRTEEATGAETEMTVETETATTDEPTEQTADHTDTSHDTHE